MSERLTKEEINLLSQINESGTTADYYYEYYKITGSEQALIQDQITTYSGAWGGGALLGSY